MSLTQAQVQFAAEFVTLVVTASALALLLLRPPPRRFDLPETEGGRRPLGMVLQAVLSGAALVALAGAAFVHGSLIVADQRVHWIGLGRVVAAAVLLLAFPYPGGPRTGRAPVGGYLLRIGFLSWLVAGAEELASGGAYLIDALLVAGSLLIAGALLRVGRRSIAVRVAASGASTLLVVVVVLALALSAVISSKAQNEELSRLSSRATVEKAVLTDTTSMSTDSQDLQFYLGARFGQGAQASLADFSASSPVRAALDALPKTADQATIAYADGAGTTVLVAGRSGPVQSPWGPIPAGGFAAVPALRLSCNPPTGSPAVVENGGSVWLVAATPVCIGGNRVGVAVATRPLDRSYLSARQRIDPGVSLALLSGHRVYATTGGLTAAQALSFAAALRPAPNQAVSAASGDRFISGATVSVVEPGGTPLPLTLLLSDQTNAALAARNQLFRTLFLIAFGGTVVALGLAIFTGDRITAGLRRLTRAAGAIAAGDASVRAGVGGDDEVASLGSAFDAMLDSVSAQAAALQAAAEDEARLRNRLQAVVAGMSDALVAVDPYGRVTDFNQAAVELTGVPAERALGASAADIVKLHNEDGMPIGHQLLQAGHRSTALMARVVRADGDIPVAVSSGALRGPAGEQSGFVLVFRDMRREQEVEQMKTEFLSRIGHELRTPLTGILGYADILLRRPVPVDRAKAWHEDILQSARRLLRIVEMLEFFASEGAGRAVLQPEPVDVRSLVNGIASSWSGRLPANLTIGRRLPKGETVVTADHRWLTLAVDELIDNAVKFSPEGGRILIKVEAGPDAVDISVSDQGMGMTAQHHDVIFGDFVQGDNSDTRRFGGLGLGLAVVRRVVEGHGGTITCRSAPGHGTTFSIGLPLWPKDRADRPAPKSDGSPPKSDGPPPKSDGPAPKASGAPRGTSPGTRRRPLRALRPSPTEEGDSP